MVFLHGLYSNLKDGYEVGYVRALESSYQLLLIDGLRLSMLWQRL